MSVCINTFLRRICRSVLSSQRLGFCVLYSPFKATLRRVYKSQCTCDDNRDPFNLLYLRTGDKVFEWEIQRSAHAFYLHPQWYTVNLLFSLKPFHFWTETIILWKICKSWPTEVTKMARWTRYIWQKTRYTLARLNCSIW